MARRGERRRAHRKRKRHHWEAAAVKKAARGKRRVHLRACTRVRHEEVQTRMLTKDPTAAARHAAAGRRPPREGAVEPSEAVREAWREAHGRTVECPRCGHLVHWRNCKAKANRRQPAELRDGDGCLGAKCGARNATAAGRAAAMRRMCEALENGTRRLVAWPATADDTDVWIRPEEAVRAILRRMEEMYGK